MIVACVLTFACIVYALGVRRVWRAAGVGRGIGLGHVWWFAAGIGVMAAALSAPLDALSDASFAAHMTQHLLLAVVAPPFLVLGAPELAVLWSLPRSARRSLGRFVARSARIRAAWHAITAPVAAWLLYAAAMWLWHAPRLFERALRVGAIHLLEHACFVATGALLWWRIVHAGRSSSRRAAYGVGIITLFATAMQTGILGALITLSPRVLYPAQSEGVARFGMTPLGDQQLAGLVMWVIGGLLYVVAMSVLFVAWLEPARRRAARTLVAASVFGAAGCQRAQATAVPGGDVARGKVAIQAMGCGACHVIDGVVGATGEVGPPLSGIARRAIVGGALANTPDNMALWIEDPPAIEPNTAMPNLGVSPQAARDIAAYLYTLK